jgi:hypothetical protein
MPGTAGTIKALADAKSKLAEQKKAETAATSAGGGGAAPAAAVSLSSVRSSFENSLSQLD